MRTHLARKCLNAEPPQWFLLVSTITTCNPSKRFLENAKDRSNSQKSCQMECKSDMTPVAYQRILRICRYELTGSCKIELASALKGDADGAASKPQNCSNMEQKARRKLGSFKATKCSNMEPKALESAGPGPVQRGLPFIPATTQFHYATNATRPADTANASRTP